MAEKRKLIRLQKRLKIRYGVSSASNLAFTEDFSENGIFIRAVNVVLPGSKLVVELYLPDNDRVEFEGKVIWGRRVPGSIVHLTKKSGMGILITGFIANEEKYRAFCRCLAERKKNPFQRSVPASAPKSGS